jgi:(4S)-4-hydroxy-5-phosphonooxypentane-2,3-dione isomerase
MRGGWVVHRGAFDRAVRCREEGIAVRARGRPRVLLERILPPEPFARTEAARMHVTLVHVRVLPGRVADFVAATRANHLASVEEPGNLRFDVLQAPDDETRFILYEAYADAHAAAAHKETAHYLAWREAVAPMMAEPRRGEPFVGLLPRAG